VHKVIPVGLYGLGAYVCRAHFLYRARSAKGLVHSHKKKS